MTPVALYARYSTDKQDARSIDDQIRRCRDYAARQGYEIVAEWADAAISGAHTERAELQRMLAAATATRRSPFQSVIVDDLSRLSRDMGDTLTLVFRDLAGAGVSVIDASTGIASDSSAGRMMFGMSAIVNDQFLQMVKHETHRGLQGRAIAGFSTGGSLYGYATHVEPNPSDPEHPRKVWAIDEAEATIVRRIFRMHDEGARSYRAIADELNREGVPPPRNNGRGGKHGGGWTHTTVRAILGNAKYAGRWTWNATKWVRVPGKRARRQHERPAAEHVVREYPELAIIDAETWGRTRDRLARETRGSGRTVRAAQTVYLVSGLLRCGDCGGPMSVCGSKTKAGVRYVQFGCTAHSSRGGAICPNATTISERRITGALLAALREVLAGPDVAEAFARAFERRVAERSRATETSGLERELREVETRIRNVTETLAKLGYSDALAEQLQLEETRLRALKKTRAAETRAAAPRALPDHAALGAALGRFVDLVASEAPERARAALARAMSPLTLTPKIESPDHYLEVVGTLDLAVIASGSSGGRI